MFAARILETAAMLSLVQTAPTPPADCPASYSVHIKRPGCNPDCSSHLHLVSRLRMCGAITLSAYVLS